MGYAATDQRRFTARTYATVFALAAAGIFTSAPSASGEIVLEELFEYPLPRSNLVQYIIRAVGTQGETITAFSNPTITAIGPGLGIHNVAQAITNADTPTRDEHLPGLFNFEWSNFDTYYVYRTNSLEPPFSETNNGATTGMLDLTPIPTVPKSGFGSYSSNGDAIVPLLPSNQGSIVAFMQVVLQSQDRARLAITVHTGPASFTREIIVGPIPEPSTAALLAMPVIGLLACRPPRRR
jgi:hypothetical protein